MSIRTGRTMPRAAAALLAAVLVGTTAGTALADGPGSAPAARERAVAQAQEQKQEQAQKRSSAAARAVTTPGQVNTPFYFHLNGIDRQGWVYMYSPDGKGGFGPADKITDLFDNKKAAAEVDNNRDGYSDGTYYWDFDGVLTSLRDVGIADTDYRTVGGGWNIYDKVLAPGDLGGAKESDIIAIDKAGVLWTYLAYPDLSVTPRVRIGRGWDQYTHIAGQGDLTGDGRADIVAKDRAGVLWLYEGTGDYTAPFKPRTKIGGGWNIYNHLLSTGDINEDGRADLLARHTDGGLWYYRGTGDPAAPFAPPVKIGWGYNMYRLMW
ncbi:FG-GAP repeat domain-containing protein [Streptomyces sp. NPDC059788]|uniref:FG-GAP repeat domain-containing protein n=1 Tax=Streptomyces sp. NPDC059788 TaxID=3346948 RepID=UPI0036464C89